MYVNDTKIPQTDIKIEMPSDYSALFQSVNICYLMNDKLNMPAFSFLNPLKVN